MKVNIGRYPKGDKQRKISVQIDPWDTWSADHTLALIIAPVLQKMKDDKQGAPHVDDADVPEHLRSTAVEFLCVQLQILAAACTHDTDQ